MFISFRSDNPDTANSDERALPSKTLTTDRSSPMPNTHENAAEAGHVADDVEGTQSAI